MFSQILLAALLITPPPRGCSVAVSDEIKRSYDDLTPLVFDVDGDGKPDKIIPRTYVGPPGKTIHRGIVDETGRERDIREKESHWIAFDLELANKPSKTFFRFKYGWDLADYWIYAIVPCRANRHPHTDLIFYAGDDTSSDTVIFMNTGRSFVVHSRKHLDDVFDLPEPKGRRKTR